jgi:hypothetical protein
MCFTHITSINVELYSVQRNVQTCEHLRVARIGETCDIEIFRNFPTKQHLHLIGFSGKKLCRQHHEDGRMRSDCKSECSVNCKYCKKHN